MANDISGRSWYIDTPGPIYPYQNFIKFIEVVGGAAGAQGGAMADIREYNQVKPIVTSLYQTVLAGEVQTYNIENWFRGLSVASLGTGVTLRVHIK